LLQQASAFSKTIYIYPLALQKLFLTPMNYIFHPPQEDFDDVVRAKGPAGLTGTTWLAAFVLCEDPPTGRDVILFDSFSYRPNKLTVFYQNSDDI
jgi:hypothetical protein